MNNDYVIRDGIVVIRLRRKTPPSLEAVIDLADLPLANSVPLSWYANWCAKSRTFYVRASTRANGRSWSIHLHQVILGYSAPMECDHANHNGLDNRRCNIRVVNHSENLMNRRRYHCPRRAGLAAPCRGGLGVTWVARVSRWQAQLSVAGKNLYLGRYPEREVALAVVAEARIRLGIG